MTEQCSEGIRISDPASEACFRRRRGRSTGQKTSIGCVVYQPTDVASDKKDTRARACMRRRAGVVPVLHSHRLYTANSRIQFVVLSVFPLLVSMCERREASACCESGCVCDCVCAHRKSVFVSDEDDKHETVSTHHTPHFHSCVHI